MAKHRFAADFGPPGARPPAGRPPNWSKSALFGPWERFRPRTTALSGIATPEPTRAERHIARIGADPPDRGRFDVGAAGIWLLLVFGQFRAGWRTASSGPPLNRSKSPFFGPWERFLARNTAPYEMATPEPTRAGRQVARIAADPPDRGRLDVGAAETGQRP